MAARSFHAVLDVSLLLIFGVNAASSSVTVPDLGGLRNASEINYPSELLLVAAMIRQTLNG
jgi:hypothetical protein